MGLVIRAHHSQAGHPGCSRLLPQLGRWYQFADPKAAERCAQGIQKACEVCQACDPARAPYRSLLEATPVPPYLMDSVAVDLFAMPAVQFEGRNYDYMAVCVDRQSGWMVVTPHQGKGLTADKVAKAMYRQWDMFGIPSVVASDRGAQFASAWWQTHQANGRAEVIGRELMKILRKMTEEEKANWVELLPLVRQHMHDIPGPTGLTPYEIVYGRERPMKGLPYTPPREAEDAIRFFDRMEKLREKVAKHLNHLHERAAEYINKKRQEKPIYKVEDKVWYLRPQDLSANLQSKWIGPCRILRRVGEGSYIIEVKPGIEHHAHDDQLKKYILDVYAGTSKQFHYYRGSSRDIDWQTDEYEAEKILAHKKRRDGTWVFKVKWKGCDPIENSWEPLNHFFHRYSNVLVKYAKEKGLTSELDVLGVLSSEAMD